MQTTTKSPNFTPQASALLRAAGQNPEITALENCTHGRNNRTYRIQTPDASYIIKQYLRQEGDTRDRLASEFTFLCYANQVAPEFVPLPFYQDTQQGMALYECIPGRPLQAQDVNENAVAQAAQFFCALNEPKHREKALALPSASEACFSIQEHLNLISGRITLLRELKAETPEDQAAQPLIERLNENWQELLTELTRATQREGININQPLPQEQRCISPSDFGFHNAIKKSDGKLCFLDFEYAGWDDPAKMTGDFFSQLALPVPGKLFDYFVDQVMEPFPQAITLIRRAELLRLVYRVKWCCIALNIFLPVHLARYRFSNPNLDVVEFKLSQLDKAEDLILSMESLNYGLH